MGSLIEINDTLQITRKQGFPKELNLEKHLKKPFTAKDFKGRVFKFHSKPQIRIYQQAGIRNFLVENKGGKWIYWGLVHILEITHDYIKKTTSGKFKIIYINTPEQMKEAHLLIDRNPDTSYFS